MAHGRVVLALSLVLLYINVTSLGEASSGADETDRLSLLDFKHGIAEDPSGALSSWNGTLHFCRWRGVTCRRRGGYDRVFSLDLPSSSLYGILSPSISNLTFMEKLDLSSNRLHGGIRPAVMCPPSLRILRLNNNSFSEEIPANLSRCSALWILNLDLNHLEGELPPALGSLPSLAFLSVGRNRLSGAIPPSLGNLSALLEALDLRENSLTGRIPDVLGKLSSLKYFVTSSNHLSGTIPISLYNLSHIETFGVSGNNLSGSIPSRLGLDFPTLTYFLAGQNNFEGPLPITLPNASSLKWFDVTGNQFTGRIPDNLGNLKQIECIHLEDNMLETKGPEDWSFITSLTNSTLLQSLTLGRNQLQGQLPHSLGLLSKRLTSLSIGMNQISGTIPPGIGNLSGLLTLSMGSNNLMGSIPAEIGKLQNLGWLMLPGNRLSGEIPPAVANLTKMTGLFLAQNDLRGSIDKCFSGYRWLNWLDISQNNLRGTIPEEIFNNTNLVYLNLSRNSFEGSLPAKVGSLNKLVTLSLSSNRLSGELPDTLGRCWSLQKLYLNGNLFQGTIPSSFEGLKDIREADLSVNNFTGKLPNFLGDFKFLRYLNLSFNKFEGEVPTTGALANVSAISIAGNNNLCGGVPELMLPSCPLREKGSRSFRLVIGVVISATCLVVLLLLLVFWRVLGYHLWMSKSIKKSADSSSSQHQFHRISYNELFKATDGFSRKNLIGSGSFGSVYKGILQSVNTSVVAVKVLNLEHRGAPRSFFAECEALRNIRHRNLVKVTTSCSSTDFRGKNFKALVYEFMTNGNLDQWLHPERRGDGEEVGRTLDFFQRLTIAIDVASALDYLHNYCHIPLVHCDVKPSNVLLDDDMIAHLGDFGLARCLLESINRDVGCRSSTVGVKGSVGYIAPGNEGSHAVHHSSKCPGHRSFSLSTLPF